MKKNILISAITFILFLSGSGAFSFAEEKKNVSPAPENVQQGCSEDDQESPSCSASASPLFDTTENQTSNQDPKLGPSSASQGTNNVSKGGS